MKRLFVLCAAALFSANSFSRPVHAESPVKENVVLTSWTDDALKMPDVPKLNMPEVHLPQMHTPQFSMPQFSMPNYRMPEMHLPQMPEFQTESISNAMSLDWLRGNCGDDCSECPCPQNPCGQPLPIWEHRDRIFGEFLYMTARGVDVVYATEVNGSNPATAVPVAASLMGNPDFEPGFRVGGALAIDCVSSISASYWNYHSNTNSVGALPGAGNFYRAELVHPSTQNVASDSLASRLAYGIDLQMADIEYKSVLCGDECHVINRVIGVRYANLDQDLTAHYSINSDTQVSSEIDFDGIGPRFGLEGEWLGGDGVYFFGNGEANLLLGQFRADYRQSNTLVVNQARTGFQDDRIVPQLELELGVGWRNRCGNLHLRAGYYITSFFNTVSTPSYIDQVQKNGGGNASNISDTITFDGLKVGAEYRF